MDFARSDDPAVQRQLDRLGHRALGGDIIGLERITALLDRLGNPQRRLPPVLHVAGTNGKGSTCAFLRACIEAAGLTAHVYTSPHLVRFNERIRVAGRLIEDAALAPLLAEVLDASADIGASFFEVTTAAAFLQFARTPADLAIVEVGMGGRLDATNVVERPAACGIAALGLDHQAFLGDTIGQIAGEKAGIARRGVPLITLAYDAEADAAVDAAASAAGAIRLKIGEAWSIKRHGDRLRYEDGRGRLDLPCPALTGAHQQLNAGIAVAMLRHQRALPLDEAVYAGVGQADWPARLQRLGPGPLTGEREIWLDGGHNVSAAAAVSAAFAAAPKLNLVIGMLANKDAQGVLERLLQVAKSVSAVPVVGHEHHSPASLAAMAEGLGLPARACADVPSALDGLDGPVLITGSLYLAGVVLALNDEQPN